MNLQQLHSQGHGAQVGHVCATLISIGECKQFTWGLSQEIVVDPGGGRIKADVPVNGADKSYVDASLVNTQITLLNCKIRRWGDGAKCALKAAGWQAGGSGGAALPPPPAQPPAYMPPPVAMPPAPAASMPLPPMAPAPDDAREVRICRQNALTAAVNLCCNSKVPLDQVGRWAMIFAQWNVSGRWDSTGEAPEGEEEAPF